MTRPGLCGACLHARPISNRRGSVFFLCGRAAEDSRFHKYPALPVLRCPGYEPAPSVRDRQIESVEEKE